MSDIHRLAVLDRDEPARRLLDAVAELNGHGDAITTIVLDAGVARETGATDEAWFPGTVTPDASASDSDERIVARLRDARADSVWIGPDAVAEPVSFTERCEGAGIAVVGPSSATLRMLTDRTTAALLAEKAGVPGALSKGDAPACRVEAQIVADAYGAVWVLGVRDCSLRVGDHALVEASASPALDRATEEAIRDTTARLAVDSHYRGIGTFAFLVEADSRRFTWLPFDPRPNPRHAVTEEVTGLDAVALAMLVACGGRLEGDAPPARGYAVEANVRAEDPDADFATTAGRIVRWRPPSGPGVRVDAAAVEGDAVETAGGAAIARVVAWGRDREDAIARLHRALATTVVAVDRGTTNRSFLVGLLGRAEIRTGRADHRLVDRLVRARGHLPEPDPVAIVDGAIAAYDAEHAAEVAAFHESASRGRPELPLEIGHRVRLRYRGRSYAVGVFRTAPAAYRVDVDGVGIDVRVDEPRAYERWITCAGRRARVVTVPQASSFLVDVDGVTHRVDRDDGAVVRAGWPAFVIAVRVQPGRRVEAGDALVELESMKMTSTVTAPFGGEVTGVDATPNTQVRVGDPLVHIREARPAGSTVDDVAARVDFGTLVGPREESDTCGREPVYAGLRTYLLGFDLEPAARDRLLAEQRAVARCLAADDRELVAVEDALLAEFTDVSALHRPQPEADVLDPEGQATASAQEYVHSYLQWLDVERAGVPSAFVSRLRRVLARYGITTLERTPELEAAVVWMFRSFRRADELVPAVTAVLERRLAHSGALGSTADDETRSRLDQLVEATLTRYPTVAELARDVRFRLFDEPLHEQVVAAAYAEMDGYLDALAADPHRADRGDLLERVVWCPQPMRPVVLRRWVIAAPAFREVLLEVHLRRFYRIRELRDLRFETRAGVQLGAADYDLGGTPIHLVVAYGPLADLVDVADAVAAHLADGDGRREVVVDLVTWHAGEARAADEMAAELGALLAGCEFGRRLHRLDVTVTSERGADPEHARTQHFTYRQPVEGGGFVEDRLYRNLHPMLAKRLEIWRLSNFELERLRSVEDVYLFRGVAHDNPRDVRLFAIAEVRDLTPARDAEGRVVGLPRLERIGLQALAAMRAAIAATPPEQRPQNNRIVVYVRPRFDIPTDVLRDLARLLAPLGSGVGLEKVVLRVRLADAGADAPLRDAVLQVDAVGRRVHVLEMPVGATPIRPLTDYRSKVLRARRLGAFYPFEIVRMLAPPFSTPGDFPPGRFVEHDLGADGALVPVDRPPGANAASLVVGLVTNFTAKVSEGMTRVAVLGDPTHSLGALAEPECRRIIAALDLAERMGVPLEWFALSSGARIAMDSGTENMDWISAVLRRLIEFTQGGGEVNVVVTGINVGAQPYWNAEATMLMHTRGILVMTPQSAMVLTGKQALDFSGGVSADDNFGIGGFDRVMGPNGQGQYWARDLASACEILLRHYDHTYVVPGERFPRRRPTTDPFDRDVCRAPHAATTGSDITEVGDVFSETRNPERKKPFDMRSVMHAVADRDTQPLERWARWRGAEVAVVWDAHVGGIPVCMIGLQARTLARRGYVPADGPPAWTSGTLFPQSSRKVARAVNSASGNRPVVVLANLSGFDGSPESMRHWQLEYGAEIGRAVTNFRGPIVFVVVSRYHGGAFVVFSKRLNPGLEIAAVEGSYASVIGGAPAAAVVFAREVKARTERDARVVALRERLASRDDDGREGLRTELHETYEAVRAEKLGEVAAEFDHVHSVHRALEVGSVDRIIPPVALRPYVIDALERGMARCR